MKKSLVSDAKTVFNALNGICCVYKPAGETLNRVRSSFLYKLSSELCELQSKPPTPYVLIEGDTTKPLAVNVFPSFVDNKLVSGPKYVPSDFKCIWVNNLGINSSGILVAALNDGVKTGQKLRHSNPLRTYRVKGCLGEAKSNLFTSGNTINYGNYKHVTKKALDQLVATVQSSHQRKMFDLCGVDIQSEAAYQLAAGGLIRPLDRKIPVIYGIKCVQFQPPHFTIEIQSINEYEAYLMALIHDLGVKLRTVAYCTGVQCIRHSYFSEEYALLKKHWTLQEVIDNISSCQKLIERQEEITVHLNEVILNRDNSSFQPIS